MSVMTVKVHDEWNLQFASGLADVSTVDSVFRQDTADAVLSEEGVKKIANGVGVIVVPCDPAVVQGRRQQPLYPAIKRTLRVVCANGFVVMDVLGEIVVQDNFWARQSLDVRIDKRFADQRQVSFDDAQVRLGR